MGLSYYDGIASRRMIVTPMLTCSTNVQ